VKLRDELIKLNVFAVELIPARNDIWYLKQFVKFFSDNHFLITFGTEHNTPERVPLSVTCRGDTPLTEDLMRINYESACVIAANQFYVFHGEEGYVQANGRPRMDQKEEFMKFGNGVIRHYINL
jgi:hypothetical protein